MNDREKFEKWWKEWGTGCNLDEKDFAWSVWKGLMPTRKAYGYGIVDKDREFAGAFLTEEEAECECYGKNINVPQLLGYPFRVVELFYE